MASSLTYIDVPENYNPFNLLKTWIERYKAQTGSPTVIFNLATSFLNGDVSNRYIELQELSEDGLIFSTNINTLKAKQMSENPKVSVNFLFTYVPDKTNSIINQQVRVKGFVECLSHNESEKIFNAQSLSVKIHSMLIQEQGLRMSWEEWRQKHDCLLKQVNRQEIELKAPEQLILYKIIPNQFDFYQAGREEIGDRILFNKKENSKWGHYHITA